MANIETSAPLMPAECITHAILVLRRPPYAFTEEDVAMLNTKLGFRPTLPQGQVAKNGGLASWPPSSPGP